MAFGQQSGPPATARQVRELLELLNAAGHTDFRDARGPMGFTQRQAAGKFTRDEADDFIARLHDEAESDDAEPVDDAAPGRSVAAPPIARPKQHQLARGDVALDDIASERLAAELQRRGWVVMEP